MIQKIQLSDVIGNANSLNALKNAGLAEVLEPDMKSAKDMAWIVYLDSSNNRVLAPWTEWDSSRTDAVGVAIMEGGRRLIIAPD